MNEWSSQERLAALVELSTDAILVVDGDGVMRWLSPSIAAVLGYAPDALTGSRVCDLVEQADLAVWQTFLDDLRDCPGVPVSVTMRCRHHDGSTRSIEGIARNLIGEPRVGAIVIHGRDVTPRLQTEAAIAAPADPIQLADDAHGLLLGQADARYRSLIEQALTGVYIVQDGRFVYASPKGMDQLGYTLEDLLALPSAFDVIIEADRAFALEQIGRLMAGATAEVQVVVRARRKDGAIIQAEAYGKIATFDGRPALVVTVLDITDRVRLEEQLRQAQKMEAIGRLAGGIAHDFNNLLTAIRGNAELLCHKLRKHSSMKADAEEVLHAADRAASLTRQLLAFSRKQDFQPVALDLNDLVESVARMVRRLIGTDVRLEIRTVPAVLPVLADPAQLEQVVLNLIVNARDALPRGGRIRVGTTNISLTPGTSELAETGLEPGDYVRLVVADNGIGMDQATQTRIFEPFFTTKEPGRGTGLGLATVYGIVRQSGGAISVRSERHRGATFTVLLPAATAEAIERAAARRQSHDSSTEEA